MHLLEDVAQFEHSMLVHNDKTRQDRHCYPGGDPCDGEMLQSLAFADYSVLHRVIHALAHGDFLRNVPKDGGSNWLRLVITTWAIADVIRCIRSEFPGLIKTAITRLLLSFSAASGICKFLNEIGVACSQKMARRKQHRACARKLKEGAGKRVRKHDHPSNYFDNCGYRKGGSKVGCLQTILIFWVILTRAQLVELQVYPDPNDPKCNVLSRERKDWLIE